MIQQFIEYMNEENPHLPGLHLEKELCPQCRGRGTSTAYLGDVTDLVHEDPDFFEDYMGGMYDRQCETCRGNNVIDVVDRSRTHPETLRHWEDWVREEMEYRHVCEMERRMGA
jgi:hypothetical protein